MDTRSPPASPLPKAQLAVLCAVRLVDSLTFTQIFPYVNQFLLGLNLVHHRSQIGFYSGLVESSFAFFQLCTIYHWGKLSDSIGRRPVIIFGTSGLVLATLVLRLSPSLAVILVSRSLAGIFSGNAAVLHSVLGELTDTTTPIKSLPFHCTVYSGHWEVSPLMGGVLANSAQRYPTLFDTVFFREYPYFLPCAATGVVAFLIALFAVIWLEETLPTKRKCDNDCIRALPSDPELLRSASMEHIPPNESFTMIQLLDLPAIRALTSSGAALCFIATAFDAVFVLFCYTPIQKGGLDFVESQIGYALSIAGLSSICLQIFVLPHMLAWFSQGKLYYICMFFWPVSYLAMPVLNLVANLGLVPGTEHELTDAASTVVWVMIFFMMVMSRFGCLAYSISLLLVKQHAPSPDVLGKSNGVVLWGMCFSRAFAPAFVSSFFAWSTHSNILSGYLWLILMVLISLFGCVLSRDLTDTDCYIRLPPSGGES